PSLCTAGPVTIGGLVENQEQTAEGGVGRMSMAEAKLDGRHDNVPLPSGMMRSAIIAAPGVIELKELPLPHPGPGQVLIRLEGSGVCASNLPVWQGREWFEYPQAPGAPGHEGWGV